MLICLRFMVMQSQEMSERVDGHVSKDQHVDVKAAPQEAGEEADMEVGMDGDVASIKTKPAEAERALPTNKQAEQSSPVKPNPKERLAGDLPSHSCNDCLQQLPSAAHGHHKLLQASASYSTCAITIAPTGKQCHSATFRCLHTEFSHPGARQAAAAFSKSC